MSPGSLVLEPLDSKARVFSVFSSFSHGVFLVMLIRCLLS
jgi:hypothetical protein